MGFFGKIFAFLTGLFNSMERYYNKLSDAEKSLSVKASAFIAIINGNIDKTPDVVFDLLQKQFPDFTKQQLRNYIDILNKKIGVVDGFANQTFEQNIMALQNHLAKHTGNDWKAITLNAVNVLLTVLLPGTPLEKITVVLEFIYQKLVKGKI